MQSTKYSILMISHIPRWQCLLVLLVASILLSVDQAKCCMLDLRLNWFALPLCHNYGSFLTVVKSSFKLVMIHFITGGITLLPFYDVPSQLILLVYNDCDVKNEKSTLAISGFPLKSLF